MDSLSVRFLKEPTLVKGQGTARLGASSAIRERCGLEICSPELFSNGFMFCHSVLEREQGWILSRVLAGPGRILEIVALYGWVIAGPL